MQHRSRTWEIAADLEAAAKAVLAASKALDAIHPSALDAVEAIHGTEYVDEGVAKALQALSDKYQAIADAEPEPGSDKWLKQSPQFHPGDLA